MSKDFIYKYLTEDDLKAISLKIGEIENLTSAELVITIKEKRSWREKFNSINQLAEKEFITAGIKNTKSGTGILFYIIFNAKEFCILADKPIDDKVSQTVWDKIAEEMANYFRAEKYREGIIKVIDEAGKILSQTFPITEEDQNELPNKIRLE